MIAFISNTEDTDTAGLTVEINKLVTSYEAAGLKGFIVFTDGMDKKETIEKMASKNQIKIPLVLPDKGDMKEINEKYKIDGALYSTVIVSKDNKIFSINFNVRPDNFSSIKDSVKKMLK